MGVTEESNREQGYAYCLKVLVYSLVCFCSNPLSQTYHIRLSSITKVL